MAVIAALAFVPYFVAAAVRNARTLPGDPSRNPVHPIGLVTVAGAWGHIPAVWLANHFNGDLYSVSFSFVGPPLIILGVVLSWRYVVRSASRAERGKVDRTGPTADEF